MRNNIELWSPHVDKQFIHYTWNKRRWHLKPDFDSHGSGLIFLMMATKKPPSSLWWGRNRRQRSRWRSSFRWSGGGQQPVQKERWNDLNIHRQENRWMDGRTDGRTRIDIEGCNGKIKPGVLTEGERSEQLTTCFNYFRSTDFNIENRFLLFNRTTYLT